MTYPTLVDHYGITGANGAPNVPLPVDVQSGDVIIIWYAYQGGTPVWDNSTAGVWTLIENHANGYHLSAYKKLCDGSESNLTLGITGVSGSQASIVHQYRGADASTVYASAMQNDSGSTISPPSLNPDGTAKDTIWIGIGLASVDITGFPGNLPDNRLNMKANPVRIGAGTASSNATSYDPGNFTLDSSLTSDIVMTMAVRAAAIAIVQPPLLSVPVTFYAPSAIPIIEPPRLDVPVSWMAFNVALDQIITPPITNVPVTFYSPTILAGAIGPPRLDVPVTFYDAAIQLAVQYLTPPRLDVPVDFDVDPNIRTRVIGGARTTPSFTGIKIGAFSYAPGFGSAAMTDLAMYNTALEGQNFASRWATRGPIGYYDFAPFVPGSYTFQDAYAWLRLSVADPDQLYAINIAKVNVDVPDVVDSRTVSISSGGQWVSFTRSFYAVPRVVANVVTASGVTTVPRVTVRDDVETGRFFCTIHYGDDLNNTLAGTVHYVASGY